MPSRSFLSFLAPALLSLLLALLTAAPETHGQNQPRPRIVRIQEASVLRVCIWPNFFGISYRNPRSGTIDGLDADMARAFAGDLGVAVEFVDSTFTALIDDLDQDRCDVAMFGIGVMRARAAWVAFSAPYLRSGIYAVTTSTNRRIRSWDDIDQPGVVVAVQAGTIMESVMRETLRQADLMVVLPPRTREQEVEAGLADVFMSDYPYTRRMLSQHDWARIIEPSPPLGVAPYAYAVKRGDDAWLSRVNAFVAAVKADGRLLAAARRYDLEPIVTLE